MIKKDSIFVKLVTSNIIIIVILTSLLSIASIYTSQMLIVDTFTKANAKNLNQVTANLIDFHNQLVNISNTVSLNKSLKEYLITPSENELDIYIKLHKMHAFYKPFTPILQYYDLTLATVGTNGLAYVTSSDTLSVPVDDIKNEYFNTLPMEASYIHYSHKNNGITQYTSNKQVIIASKVLNNISSKMFYGVLLISIDEKEFKQLYTQTITPGNTISIISQDGTILSSSNQDLIGSSSPELYAETISLINSEKDWKNLDFNGRDAILSAQYVPYLDFYIVNTIDKDIALYSITVLKKFVFILVPILIGITIIVVFLISKKISKPLTEMVQAISSVGEGDLQKKLHIEGNYEVQVLSNTFNIMVENLQVYIDKLISEQEERRKAELHALQMQIHPHFLYNTLSSIKYLAWQGRSKEVGTTIDALISLLQNTIGNVDDFIYVKEEIKNLSHYITIIQTRYGDGIDVSYTLSSECMDCQVPKLLLQPFIENAFFHAFTDTQQGLIIINSRKVRDNLVLEIIDNGIGMDLDNLSNPQKNSGTKKHFTGIGITNINERIKLLYGLDYGVNITSQVGYGTCIKIVLPFISHLSNKINS